MPRLYCDKDSRERLAGIIEHQEEYRQEGETVLVVTGRLRSGPWQCDCRNCNASLGKGDRVTLATAFPRHFREQLYNYDFGYELEYFAMSKSDRVAVYGADWPDDSVRTRRNISRPAPPPKEPLCALELFPTE